MANSFLEALRQSAEQTSPLITQLILQRKQRSRDQSIRSEELERAKKEEANKARLSFLTRNYDKFDPNTQKEVLGQFGIETKTPAGTGTGLDYLRSDPSIRRTPEESSILRDVLGEEQKRGDIMSAMQALGIEKQPAVNAIGSGVVQEGAFPGLGRSPESIATEKSLGAQTTQREESANRQRSLQRYDEARIAVQNAKKDVENKKLDPKGDLDQKRLALDNLQDALLAEKKTLSEAMEGLGTNYAGEVDAEELVQLRKLQARSKELDSDLSAVQNELKGIGGVQQPGEFNKKVNPKTLRKLYDNKQLSKANFKRMLKEGVKKGKFSKDEFGQALKNAVADDVLTREEAYKLATED